LLEHWLGERWVGRCIRVDSTELSTSHIQQIVAALLPGVPVPAPPQAAADHAASSPGPGACQKEGLPLRQPFHCQATVRLAGPRRV